jgi:hypothetical protein
MCNCQTYIDPISGLGAKFERKDNLEASFFVVCVESFASMGHVEALKTLDLIHYVHCTRGVPCFPVSFRK